MNIQITPFLTTLYILYVCVRTINMIYKTLLLLALILALGHSEVVVLDDSNYTTFVQEHPLVFVQFYAPWCGHCKQLAPEYEKLAQMSVGKEYVIAKVDSTVAENISKELGVQGYPTLKFIVNGDAVDFSGDRSAKGIQEWIENLLKSEVTQVTEQELKELIGTKDLLLIQGASRDQLKLLRLAQGVSTTSYYSLQGGDFKITLYLKNSKTLEYTGEFGIKALTSWLSQSTLGHLTALLNSDVIKLVFENEAQLPAFLLHKSEDFTDEKFEVLRQYCEQNVEKFKCGYADSTHKIYLGISRFLQAEEGKTIVAYLDFGIQNGYKVPNPTQITKQSLSQFLVDVSEGKAQKFHDEAKAKEEKKVKYVNVLQLTNETYNQTLKNNKYVFVEYYSPTCGHCVKLAPEYEALATKFKEQKSEVIIAAVDLNSQPDVDKWVSINGYPTLRFYVNGNELDYSGARDAENIEKYIISATKSQLKTISSIEDLQKPAVAVYGITDDSPLNLLPFLFSRFPVYRVLGESTFKVEIHDKKSATLLGDDNLRTVSNWLIEQTEPVIVNIVEEHPTRKLSRALEANTPILAIVNRDNSDAFKNAFEFLEKFCEDKLEYICGTASKDDKDYDNFNDWLKDTETEKSRLVYLNTEKFNKYFFPGDIGALTEDIVNQFTKDINDGKILPHDPKVQQFHEVEQEGTETAETAEATATPDAAEATETPEATETAATPQVVVEQL